MKTAKIYLGTELINEVNFDLVQHEFESKVSILHKIVPNKPPYIVAIIPYNYLAIISEVPKDE